MTPISRGTADRIEAIADDLIAGRAEYESGEAREIKQRLDEFERLLERLIDDDEIVAALEIVRNAVENWDAEQEDRRLDAECKKFLAANPKCARGL